jgi:phage baseplate assembly protein W
VFTRLRLAAVLTAPLGPRTGRFVTLALPLAPRTVPKSPDRALPAARRAAPYSPSPPNSHFKPLKREPNPDAYIEQLIRQVILTAPGERIHRPDFGGGLQRQVFALNSFATAVIAEPIVYQALDRWLGGLIRVEKVEATAQDATMLVAITYVVLQRGVRRYLNLEVGA